MIAFHQALTRQREGWTPSSKETDSSSAKYPKMSRKSLRVFRDDSGWSLSELLIVLVIIGILALLALPRFMSVADRAKMAEAQGMLRHLHTLQQAHYYQFDRYGETLEAIGFEQVPLITDGGTARYRIEIEHADLTGYSAIATAVVDFSNNGRFNVWQVDETGSIEQRVAD